MLTSKKPSNKKYPTSKSLPPDQSSLKMKILRATFVTHCMSDFLNRKYVPLDPSNYGWKLQEKVWQPIWFEGNPLPNPDEIINNNDGESFNINDSVRNSVRAHERALARSLSFLQEALLNL